MNLPRTLEPEVMDSAEEVAEYSTMDHGEVNARFVTDLCDGGQVGPRVIDLGCGPAAILIELCRRREDVTALGTDASVAMLELAKQEIDLAGMLDRIALEHADVKTMRGFATDMADTVISNSLLHHLADPASAILAALRLVRDGGRLFIRDLARPDSERDLETLVETHAGDESAFARQLLRQSLHAALTLDEARALCGGCGIDPDRVQMSSDRHWTLDWTGTADDASLSATA